VLAKPQRRNEIAESRQSDSNRRPADYKSAALPAELCRQFTPWDTFCGPLPRPLYTPFVCAIPNGKYKVRDWECCLRAHNVASPEMLYFSGGSGLQFDEGAQMVQGADDVITHEQNQSSHYPFSRCRPCFRRFFLIFQHRKLPSPCRLLMMRKPCL
jgi:hypothetical protein